MEDKKKYIKYKKKYLKLQKNIKFGGANDNKCIIYLNNLIEEQENTHYINKIVSIIYENVDTELFNERFNHINKIFIKPKKYDELVRNLRIFKFIPPHIISFSDFKKKKSCFNTFAVFSLF